MGWFNYRGRVQKVSQKWDASAPAPRQALLESLYAWERRLRGYDLFPAPVALEPAFAPFEATWEAGDWDHVPQTPDLTEGMGRTYLPILLPIEQNVTPAQMGQCLASLRSLRHPLALEIIATASGIHYQVSGAATDATAVAMALQGAFPQGHWPAARLDGAGKADVPDALLQSLDKVAQGNAGYRVVDFGLGEAVYRPLPLLGNFNPDPQGSLVAALGTLDEGEMAGFQLLLSPASGPWERALGEFVDYFEGGSQAAYRGSPENEMERALRLKLGSPLWAATLRVFAFTQRGSQSQLGARALQHCQVIAASLLPAQSSFSHHGVAWNELLALDDTGYEMREHLSDLLERRSRRSGMLLSGEEVVGLWHPPAPSLSHPRLLRYDPRRRELPDYLREADGAALGILETGEVSSARSEPTLVPWPDAYRNRHAYLLGATRMGKSTLLGNLIAQDLLAGRGLCLIDPHGDLAGDVLHAIPPHREADVLYLDLSDTAFPVSLGLLQARDEWEKRLLVSDLLSILHRLFATSWGDRLEHILRHALLTLLADQSEPHTLRDIRPLLSDPAYREYLLPHIGDPDLQSFWKAEFPGYSAAAFAPVFNKLGLLLSSPLVRNIVAGGPSAGESEGQFSEGRLGDSFDDSTPLLDPASLIQNRRILIVNLAQSLIGEDNAHFLGALLVSKIQLAAMHGLRQGRGERVPFTLYVDEFQNFVVSSFAKILSEAGKAGLSLVMANQFLEQLNENLQTAILSNVGALLSFRVSAASGRRLQGEFGNLFEARDLTDLERGHAIVRLGKAGDSFALRTFAPILPEDVDADPVAPERIVTRTRREICRPRAEVEAGLRQSEARVEEIRAQWQARQEQKKQEQKKQEEKKGEQKKGESQKSDVKDTKEKKPVEAKPVEAKPVEAKTEAAKPEAAKPEAAKPEAKVPGPKQQEKSTKETKQPAAEKPVKETPPNQGNQREEDVALEARSRASRAKSAPEGAEPAAKSTAKSTAAKPKNTTTREAKESNGSGEKPTLTEELSQQPLSTRASERPGSARRMARSGANPTPRLAQPAGGDAPESQEWAEGPPPPASLDDQLGLDGSTSRVVDLANAEAPNAGEPSFNLPGETPLFFGLPDAAFDDAPIDLEGEPEAPLSENKPKDKDESQFHPSLIMAPDAEPNQELKAKDELNLKEELSSEKPGAEENGEQSIEVWPKSPQPEKNGEETL